MKYPTTLPWKVTGNHAIGDYEDYHVAYDDRCLCDLMFKADAEYIVTAANMLPEFVTALEGLISITEHVALKDYTPVDKAKELLNRIKT